MLVANCESAKRATRRLPWREMELVDEVAGDGAEETLASGGEDRVVCSERIR
jgi:hypothetical protein